MPIGPPIPEIQFNQLNQSNVRDQCQRYPSQCSLQLTHFHNVSHQGILSTPILFVSRQSGLPFLRHNLTLKIQGQRSTTKVPQSKQHLVDLFSWCFTSGLPIDSRPFCSMTIRPPIPAIQFVLENSRSKVKVKGQGQRYLSKFSIQLTHFLFVSHQLDQPLLRYGK